MTEPDERRAASAAFWDAMAPGWERLRARIDAQMAGVTERMLDLLTVPAGGTILDLAAGTGELGFAALARAPGSRLITADVSPAMLEAARRRVAELALAGVEIREVDAHAMEFPDDHVDAVLCRFGFMTMPDPDAALREARRVLRAGGALVLAVWGPHARNPWATLIVDVLADRGTIPRPDHGAPGGMFALADEEDLRARLGRAGFEEVETERITASPRFASEEDFWGFFLALASPLQALVSSLPDEDRAEVEAEAKRRVAAFRVDGELVPPSEAIVARAR